MSMEVLFNAASAVGRDEDADRDSWSLVVLQRLSLK